MQSHATYNCMRISEQEFKELLDRYLNNTASAEERDILDRFFDSYQGAEPHPLAGDPALQQELLLRIHAKVHAKTDGEKRRMIRLWLPLAAAIGLFILAYFFVGNFQPAHTGENPAVATVVHEKAVRGRKLVTRLPDGTRVHLNSESTLSYNQDFGDHLREVTVQGEAYFEVVKDIKPFVVHADGIRTEVLGTSFNVKRRGSGQTEVTLAEGKVKVFGPSGESIALEPNEQAVLHSTSGVLVKKEVNVVAFTSWKDNILFFEKTTLKDAMATLERWYDVEIVITDSIIEDCVITAKYQDEPLANVLSSFQFLFKLKIDRVNEGRYAVSGPGCK